ncbi:MAG: NAD(P)H-dependent oxidoreductase [Fidelibacterota bacterium]|nr:MAG: NAD(P)H-dependent oxidoreductase [Candidatus Neomarinimicrobiota bacterium]
MKNRIIQLCYLLSIIITPIYSQGVLIVYYSTAGHTAAMAEAVVKGARSVKGVTVKLLAVERASVDDVLAADAIILGSPVYNANVAPPMQQFINSWPFQGQPLRDKIGAAFVTGGGISAGEELTQLNILSSMLIFNMIVVGGPTWQGAFGASGITGELPFGNEQENGIVQPRFLAKGEALGRRVAELAGKLHGTGAPD